MIGAIIGDIVGSRFEWHNIKTKRFQLFDRRCSFTDDSVMTLAVSKAVLDCRGDLARLPACAVQSMQEIGRHYPDCGYGGRFYGWVYADDPAPYNSWGNGSAMRVSPVGWAARDLRECLAMSEAVTAVSHNHPEGIRGANAIAAATFLALHGADKAEIRKAVETQFGYDLSFTLDSIRPSYTFDVSCLGTVPPAIVAFLESTDFEDAIRNAVSIGGDSDTLAACTGAARRRSTAFRRPSARKRKRISTHGSGRFCPRSSKSIRAKRSDETGQTGITKRFKSAVAQAAAENGI